MTIYISKGSVSYLVNQNNFMTKYKEIQTSNSSCDSKNNLRLQESSRSTRVMKRSYINIMYHINHQSFQKVRNFLSCFMMKSIPFYYWVLQNQIKISQVCPLLCCRLHDLSFSILKRRSFFFLLYYYTSYLSESNQLNEWRSGF